MLLDNIKFNIGQIVYLKTDKEQLPRIVTCIILKPENVINYGLTSIGDETWHYGFEIEEEKNVLLSTTN